jgi:hypothetical protein
MLTGEITGEEFLQGCMVSGVAAELGTTQYTLN